MSTRNDVIAESSEQAGARPAAMDSRAQADETKAILRRIGHMRLAELPIPVLQSIDAELAEKQRAISQEALVFEEQLRSELASGHGTLLSSLRKSTRRLERRLDEISDERERVENAYQEKVLEDHMIGCLGSHRRVQALEGLVLVLIFFVLGLLVYEMLTPRMSYAARRNIFLIDTACCVVFLSEFFLRHRCADSKRWYWRRYWVDFVTSIPLPDAALLRSGRLARGARIARLGRVARAARFLRVLRAMRIILFFWRGMDKLHDVLDVRLMKKSLAIGVFILLFGAVAIRWAESAHREVSSLGRATWWSFTTLVTGGYGDIHNPESVTGQVVTVILVIAGMVVVGVFTATLTSILVSDNSDEMESLQRGFDRKVDALSEKIDALNDGATPDSLPD